MKKLFLIRHAKSSWDDATLKDFDRPLNKRGEQNAPLMAKRLKTKGVAPELIYSSPANRAKITATLIAQELDCLDKINFISSLYDTYQENILELIRTTPPNVNTLFIVAHNPELNDLAQFLVEFNANLPTAGILEIKTSCHLWEKISPENCLLLDFDYPKKTN